jgi:hypothetical protein
MDLVGGKLVERTSAKVSLQTPGVIKDFQGEHMEFTELGLDASSGEGTLISKRQNNGDWDYWWVIESIDWPSATGDNDATWCVSLSVVAPDAVPDKEKQNAIQSCGWDGFEDLEGEQRELAMVEILHSYGIKACLWERLGGNPENEDEDETEVLEALILCARQVATIGSNIAFGFWMDQPLNAIGSTGWDFVAGDITAGLYK